jgi:hypothetical protein
MHPKRQWVDPVRGSPRPESPKFRTAYSDELASDFNGIPRYAMTGRRPVIAPCKRMLKVYTTSGFV